MSKLEHKARGFAAPRRYIQGPDEIYNLHEHVKVYGSRIYVLVDTFLFAWFQEHVQQIFPATEAVVVVDEFKGEVTKGQVDRFSEKANRITPDVVIGIGGGKCIDAIRIVAGMLKTVLVVVPTLASTDAPVAGLSALFNDEGEQVGIVRNENCTDIVIVDSQIIAKAPVRYFVAGIGDAIATCFEAKLCAEADSANFVGKGYGKTIAGMAICEACEKTILAKGIAATYAVSKGLCTPDVEDVIEANTLLSGLGYHNVGLSGAHATNTGLTVLKETKQALHGELVAFGTLVQLVIQQKPQEEMEELYQFYYKVGLPKTLADLGVWEITDEKLALVAKKALSGFWRNAPFLVTEQMLIDAIRYVDAYGTERG